MEQNLIDIIVKNENLINAVQNELNVCNTELNSSVEEIAITVSWPKSAIFTYTTNTGQVDRRVKMADRSVAFTLALCFW